MKQALELILLFVMTVGPFLFAVGWILSTLRQLRQLEIIDALTQGMEGDIVTRVTSLKFDCKDLRAKVAELEERLANVTDIPY